MAEQKNKMKPRGGNSPVIGDNGIQTKPGDNSKYLNFSLAVSSMPPIDNTDTEQLTTRINEYFTLCAHQDMKPTVAGLGLAVGADRKTLWEWKTGGRRLSTHADIIKKAYQIMENLWEDYMQNGKINPTAGLFLGVNNYGYYDVKQINVTPTIEAPLGQELPREEIINALPQIEDNSDD